MIGASAPAGPAENANAKAATAAVNAPRPRKSPPILADRCGRVNPTWTLVQSPRVRTYVEPSPSGGYFVRLSGEPAPLSRHDTEEEAEAAAAAYARGLARRDLADHVVLAGNREVEIRPAAGVDHVDEEAIEATSGGEVVGVA